MNATRCAPISQAMSRRLTASLLLLALVVPLFPPAAPARAAISSVAQTPAANAAGTGDVTVTWQQSQAHAQGQVWYWVDDPSHAVNHFAAATRSGAGPYTWTATIPGQSAGQVVEYQVQNWDGAPDEYDDNGGLFYGYGASASTSATYHTIHVNGDLADWRANELLGSVSGVSYYLTWDADYIYVGWTGGNAGSDKYTLLIDVDPAGNEGATAAFAGANFPANAAPDYAVQWRSASDDFWFATGSGGGWSGAQENSDWGGDLYGADSGGNPGAVELRIARGQVGLTDTAAPWAVYLIASNSSDQLWSAFPANNPQTNGADLTTAWYWYASKSDMPPNADGFSAPFGGVKLLDTDDSWVAYNHSRGLARANGRWWALYLDGPSDGNPDRIALRSSPDGVTWSDAVEVYQPNTDTTLDLSNLALWAEATTLHAACVNFTDDRLVYRRIDVADPDNPARGTLRVVQDWSTDVLEAGVSVALTQGRDRVLWLTVSHRLGAAELPTFYWSADGGVTWRHTGAGATTTLDGNLSVLVPLDAGRILAIGAESTDNTLQYATWNAVDAWSAWSPVSPNADMAVAGRLYDAAAVSDGAGNAILAWATDSGAAVDTLRVYRYQGDAGAWKPLSSVTVSDAHTGLEMPTLHRSANGDLYLVYKQTTGSAGAYYWRQSTDGGATWSTARQIGYTETDALYWGSLNESDDGLVALYLQDTNSPGPQDNPMFALVDVLTAPRTPALDAPFDNALVASTTPDLTFAAADPGRDGLRYQVQVSADETFAAPAIDDTSSPGNTAFYDTVAGTSEDPFASGNTIRYTVPSALTDGGTYYWRVRAQDPAGAAAWSGWSAVRSFTIDTTADGPAWFQTARGQFRQDARFGYHHAGYLYAAVAGDQVVPACTKTFLVNHGLYDAFDDGSVYDYATTSLRLGHTALDGDATAGWRFPRVTFRVHPYLDWVEDAYLLLTNDSAAGDTPVNLALYADDQVSSPDFGDEARQPSTRTATSAQVDWDIQDAWGLAGAVIRSPNLRDVVQEIVNLDGWDGDNNPNPITLVAANDGGSHARQVTAYDGDPGAAAKLVMTAQDNVTIGLVESPPIVFDKVFGSGTWGQLYWTADTPHASTVYVQVHYVNASGEVVRVPDAALPGNGAASADRGFVADNAFKQTYAVDLSGLDTGTYGTLVLRAQLVWGTNPEGTYASTFLEWGLTQGSTTPSDTSVSRAITTDAYAVYTFGPTGLTVRFDDPPDVPCNMTVHVYRNQAYNDDPTTIDRYWDVSLDGTPGTYEAVLNLAYAQSEYAGCTDPDCPGEAGLRYKHWDSGLGRWDIDDTRVGVAAARSADANVVTVTGVKRLSPITLGGGTPTAVTLTSFTARPGPDGITLAWETASELDVVGFAVYRSVTTDGPWARLIGETIPSQTFGSPAGATYEWLDGNVQPGATYHYELAIVATEHTTRYGPVSAIMPAGSQFRIYLPLVGNDH
ncbi:MAG: glycoside hydrolase [Chloroflexi bacterium]|nr:glycoside hydrolase [Chloroflexota bacterium]